MARRYTQLEKQIALDAVASGQTVSEVASAQGIGVSTLRRWIKADKRKDAPAPAPRPTSVKPVVTAVAADQVQLVVVDSAGDIPKIARILSNENLLIEITRLAEHSHAKHVEKHFLWRQFCCVIDVNEAAARRIFDLVRRSGRGLPGALVGPSSQLRRIEDQPLLLHPTVVEPTALAMLGTVLDREYQLFRQRLRVTEYETQIRQLQQCYESTFDASSDPVAIICNSGHRYANPAYLRLFEHKALEQLQEVQFPRLVADRSKQSFLEALDQLNRVCAVCSIDLELQSGTRARAEVTRLPGTSGEFQMVFRSHSITPCRSVVKRPGAADIARSLEVVAPAVAEKPLVADPSDENTAVWTGRVARALQDENLFSLLYQPIVGLSEGVSGMYEALLRMSDSDGTEYLPGSFMPAAEQAGLMTNIDQWVIQRAVKVVKAEAGYAAPLTLFLNLSRDSLYDTTFARWLKGVIRAAEIDAGQVVLEIGRLDVMQDLSAARRAVEAIRATGCAVALDGFCEESASTGLIRNLTVDYVKIERALILQVAHSDSHLDRIKTIVTAATKEGVRTIAGYVQEADSVSRLWRCGVDYVQGYFLQHPSHVLDYDFNGDEHDVPATGAAVS